MTHVDFKNVRDNVQIDRVAEWLGISSERFMGEQLRARCPIHGGGKRALVDHAIDELCSFASPTNARRAETPIELTAKIRQIPIREAALALQAHFLDYQRKVGTADNPLHKIDYLEADHDAVQALGISADVARMLGIGYAGKGTMIKRVLFPIRTEDGKLVGYIGYNAIWILSNSENIPSLAWARSV